MTLGRARRTELLAVSGAVDLVRLADRCLHGTDEPELLAGPEVGVLVQVVREPVENTRFQLADVLVTRAHLVHRGAEGWAMRLGSDRAATLAAAVCDAEVEAGGPAAALVEELCHATRSAMVADRELEWEQLVPTMVRFEEMGE